MLITRNEGTCRRRRRASSWSRYLRASLVLAVAVTTIAAGVAATSATSAGAPHVASNGGDVPSTPDGADSLKMFMARFEEWGQRAGRHDPSAWPASSAVKAHTRHRRATTTSDPQGSDGDARCRGSILAVKAKVPLPPEAIRAAHHLRTEPTASGTSASRLAPAVVSYTGAISGTVTDASTQGPIGGVDVYAYSDCTPSVAHAVTATDGTYTFSELAPCSYGIGFEDHVHSHIYASSYATVSTSTVVVNQALVQGGSIAGTITASDTAAPLDDACVDVFTLENQDEGVGGCTDATGHFQTTGLAAGCSKLEYEGVGAYLRNGGTASQTRRQRTPLPSPPG